MHNKLKDYLEDLNLPQEVINQIMELGNNQSPKFSLITSQRIATTVNTLLEQLNRPKYRHTEEHSIFFSVLNDVQKRVLELMHSDIENAIPGWMTTHALATELKVDYRTIKRMAQKHCEELPNGTLFFRDTSGNISLHYSPDICAAIRLERDTTKRAPTKWETKRSLSKRLSVSEAAIKKVAQIFLTDHPEWSQLRINKGWQKYEHYSPELVKKIILKISRIDAGWLTSKAISRKLNLSQDRVWNLLARFIVDHPEWIKTSWEREYFSPELVSLIEQHVSMEVSANTGSKTGKEILEILKMIPEIPKNILERVRNDISDDKAITQWTTTKSLTKNLGITFKTVQNIATHYLKTHPEWMQPRRDNGGRVLNHYSPELVLLIKAEYTSRASAPEWWKNISEISETTGVSRKQIRWMISNVWLISEIDTRQFQDKSGKLTQYYSPSLVTRIWNGLIPKETPKDEFENLSHLKAEEAIALLIHDPYKLKLYIQFAHPELSNEEISILIRTGFKGLNAWADRTKENEYLDDYIPILSSVEILTEIPEKTEESTIILKGKAPLADIIYITGSWTRPVRVQKDGSFEVVIPLKIGEVNEFRIMSISGKKEHDAEKRKRSEQISFFVSQIKEKDDIQELMDALGELGDSLRDQIQTDPHRLVFFQQCMERVVIKKFAHSFEAWERYVSNLIEQSKSQAVQNVLRMVLVLFEKINTMNFSNLSSEVKLYFFQKYCIYKIHEARRLRKPGIILANEPGLGKTGTALVAINQDNATIVSPNSVVSTWAEEAQKFLDNPQVLVLQDISAYHRKKLLEQRTAPHIITNIEFLRDSEDEKRFALLGHQEEDFILLHDEAHSRGNLHSLQSQGVIKLSERSSFQILLSASPVKDSVSVRRLLHTLFPKDKRFSNDQVFTFTFPSNDPQALKTLNLLLQEHVIRFRKQDVMEEMDPNIPVTEQRDRLPKKKHISPEEIGKFELTEEQSWAMYEMFTDWKTWTEKYDRYIPKNHLTKLDWMYSGDQLSKRHALRQIANNPDFIGSTVMSPKHTKMKEIVEKCLAEGRKPIIFCRYNTQALEYAKIFSDLQPSLYTGVTANMWKKKDKNGRVILYRYNENGSVELDEKGYPIIDPKGQPILAIDYERITFQHSRDRQLMISTYAAGAVGVTFTAWKAEIFDDLPQDYIEQYQAEDRAHRIDNKFLTHHDIKYFSLVSVYPETFLEKMKHIYLQKLPNGTYEETDKDFKNSDGKSAESAYEIFFSQGSFDQVQRSNLEIQRQVFHLINDGISDESILKENQVNFIWVDK
jgi:hypothetical protein